MNHAYSNDVRSIRFSLAKGGHTLKQLWVFPGQGGQHGGMLAPVPAVLKERVASLLDMSFPDTDTVYTDSVQLQVAIALLQVSEAQELMAAGFTPELAAGHSLGVFAAAYSLGSLQLDDLFKIVHYRASLMQASYPSGYGMGVIVGLPRTSVAKLVAQVTTTDAPVYTSNQNAPDQVALSGELTAIDAVLQLAKANGAAKALRLRVPVPSHSPLMNGVAQKLTKAMAGVQLTPPQGIYLTNDGGRPTKDPEVIRRDLSDNLAHPVFFDDMLAVAADYYPQVVVSFQPGQPFRKVLANRFSDDVHQIGLASMSIDDATFLLNKWERGSQNE